MTSADIIAVLEQQFGDRIKSKNLTAIDPFVVVAPADLLDVCRFLKDDPRLQFDLLNCISGVDYLEPDPKKAPKAGFDPHTGSRLSPFQLPAPASVRAESDPAALEGRQAGRTARSAVRHVPVAHGRLARARSLRPVRRLFHRPSRT